MNQIAVLGNEAIGRGLIEAGVSVVTAYPGTPSSEILPTVVAWKKQLGLNIYAEWSVNEKVALEVALAASWAGKRAAVAMKQVGLNVASDPLLSAAYTGVVGGFVAIVCDDPGPHSSQTEQDTRLFAMFAKVPVLDPATPREAQAMVHAAFALSEKYRVPVILRAAVRVAHARGNIPLDQVTRITRPAAFKKDPARWAATPRYRLLLHRELNDKLAQIEHEFETSELNHWSIPRPTPSGDSLSGRFSLGVIGAGVPAATAAELLDEFGVQVPVLKIGTVYPLPRKQISDFINQCERVLVVEEPDAAIELQIPDRTRVSGRLDGTIPNAGELTPDVLYPMFERVLSSAKLIESVSRPLDSGWDQAVKGMPLPARPPRLCPGCGHRSSFYSIRRTFPGAIFTSDIGCYTLGTNLRAVDTCLDMGAAITIATGLYHAYQQDGKSQPIVATIGDSTFIHSGVTGLMNAVHSGARFVLVILDNGTTAMTGFQPTADTTRLADGDGERVAIPDIVRACGVKFMEVADPYYHDQFQATLKRAAQFVALAEGGMAVVIAKRPCVLNDRSPIDAHPVRVDVTVDCDGCKYCLVSFECPALVLNAGTNKVEIDRATCVDCGQCIEACYKGFIVESNPVARTTPTPKVGFDQRFIP